MTTSADMLDRLRAPFPADVVSWRVGPTTKDKAKGAALAYIDARDVMDRFDDVCGPAGWQCDYLATGNGTACCRISVKVGGEWIGKANGAGATGDVGNEREREMAEKGAFSDAFKRAAVLWGVGRYLYALDAPWVRLDERGQIHQSELPRLKALLGGQQPKSAYQARKDGDWKSLAEGLSQCGNLEAIALYLSANETLLATMPEKWKPHWDQLVEQRRDAVRAVAA